MLAGAAVHTTHPTLWLQVGLQEEIDTERSDRKCRRCWQHVLVPSSGRRHACIHAGWHYCRTTAHMPGHRVQPAPASECKWGAVMVWIWQIAWACRK